MTSETRTVQCIFYSHPWAVHMLKHAGLGEFDANQVLVELAEVSNLAPVFGEQGKARWGLAGLLRLSGRLEQLVQTFKNVPSPVVLSPKPEVPAASLCAAAGMLAHTPGPHAKATLLINIQDAELFIPVYPHVDRFSILWDLADPAHGGLVKLAEVLAANHCLTPETWAGFHVYKHPNRAVSDAEQRRADFNRILEEFPALAVA